MYKTLIVDDDELILESLKKIIPWDEIGIVLSGAATDSFSALELVKKEKPDILLTDIEMPIMSGLELAKRAQGILPELVILILSGHESFSYAKQALEMHAIDYILKPLDRKLIAEKLSACVRDLDARRLKNERLREYTTSYRSDIIYSWLEGSMEFENVDELLKDSLLGKGAEAFFTVVLEIDRLNFPESGYSQEQGKLLISEEYTPISQMLDEIPAKEICRTGENQYALIVQHDRKAALELFENLIRQAAQEPGILLTISIGPEFRSLEETPGSYKKANEAIQLKAFCGKGRIIAYGSGKTQKILDEKKHFQNHLDHLFFTLASFKAHDLEEQLGKISTILKKQTDRIKACNLILYVVFELNKFLRGLGEDIYALLDWDPRHLDIVYRMDTADEMCSFTKEIFLDVMNAMKIKRQRTKGVVIEKMESYVIENIESDITLKEVADHLALSPNYLGYFYKEETGEYFSDFLARKKMERAMELLANTSLKIYEVANRLGYASIPYFHSKFKEYFGVPPGKFRNSGG